jgi:hypothetical protein
MAQYPRKPDDKKVRKIWERAHNDSTHFRTNVIGHDIAHDLVFRDSTPIATIIDFKTLTDIEHVNALQWLSEFKTLQQDRGNDSPTAPYALADPNNTTLIFALRHELARTLPEEKGQKHVSKPNSKKTELRAEHTR